MPLPVKGSAIFLAPYSWLLAPYKRNFRAGDRPQAPGPCALRELHRAVQAVVVSERERLVSQLQRAQHELIDMRSAFEEREIGVGVKFGVGRHMFSV